MEAGYYIQKQIGEWQDQCDRSFLKSIYDFRQVVRLKEANLIQFLEQNSSKNSQ